MYVMSYVRNCTYYDNYVDGAQPTVVNFSQQVPFFYHIAVFLLLNGHLITILDSVYDPS